MARSLSCSPVGGHNIYENDDNHTNPEGCGVDDNQGRDEHHKPFEH